MRGRAAGAALLVGAVFVVVASACGRVDGVVLSNAPTNVCPEHPCESYPELVAGRGRPQCTAGRCEYGAASLTYPYRIVVHVPTSSLYGAGLTFLLSSDDLRRTNVPSACAPPTCLRLPDVGEARGRYTFTAEAASAVGLALEPGVSVPLRVSFVPLAEATGQSEASELGLPLDTTFASSALQAATSDAAPEVVYAQPVTPGRYLRCAYPQPPYDAFLPPAIDVFRVSRNLVDEFVLGSANAPLDDPSGAFRTALVRRAEGLWGWRIWLADSTTGRRISTLRTLDGVEAEARLDTSRQNAPGTAALREGVDVVVAPPADWVAVPSLVNTLIGGTGLRPLNYPSLPPPVSITGLVAVRQEDTSVTSPGSARGVPARVLLRSTSLVQQGGDTSQLLRYETSVTTDASGLFSTVLPPGVYSVTVEPDTVTRRGKVTRTVEVPAGERFALNLEPEAQTVAEGRAVVADGRPLAEADVVALPVAGATRDTRELPRPARTRTGPDGGFALSLDRGAYQLAIEPQAGTGFPRVVALTAVDGDRVELPTIEVAAPIKLSFALRSPNTFIRIAHAVVRVFAELPSGESVEVGRTLSTDEGQCDILLAREPR